MKILDYNESMTSYNSMEHEFIIIYDDELSYCNFLKQFFCLLLTKDEFINKIEKIKKIKKDDSIINYENIRNFKDHKTKRILHKKFGNVIILTLESPELKKTPNKDIIYDYGSIKISNYI